MHCARCWQIGVLIVVLTGCGQPPAPPTPTSDSATQSSASAAVPVSSDNAPLALTSQSGVEMVALPAGEFLMGSDRGNPDEAPAHKVRVSAFMMDKYEVSHELFAKAQLPNPSHWQDHPKKPVERVRWRDAKQYCNERSLLEGLKPCYDEKTPDWTCDFSANGYRLPTEAEWEYACRAGSTGAYDFGQADKLRLYSWFSDNAGERTHPVGEKKPNRWGLFDLYGNVSEWCEDVYSADYYQHSPSADPAGPASTGKDVKRVMRGGSWKASTDMSRASYRQGQPTGDSDACFFTDYCGFRCVRRATAAEIAQLRGTTKP